MTPITLTDVLQATKGQLLSEKEKNFQAVGSDTRADLKGQLFFALQGESFDAHQFLSQAVDKGAAALVVHEARPELEALKKKVTVILVPNTLQALQDFALYSRRKSPSLIVGITGSNGKTTSKEFSAAVLSTARKVHFPKGSFNNHWGVPFTLLAEPAGSQVSLIEMGMNHSGEIQRLCEIAEPDVVVVSMVGRAHIEHFGTIEKIAEAKEEIYQFAKPEAIRIYNLDNPFTARMHAKAKKEFPLAQKILTFSSLDPKADVFFQIEVLTMSSIQLKGQISGVSGKAKVNVFGEQNLVNLMVAASIGLASGMTPVQIWPALEKCKTNWGRNQLVHLKSGAELLFDAYNANPDSMSALLENVKLLKTSGKKVGVFAEMLELGDLSAQLHRELGEKVGRSGFDLVWFYGADSQSFEAGLKASQYSKKSMISNVYEESLASDVASMLNEHDTVLVKGSRGMKLERFVMACDPVDFSLKKED
ncbi:MAG: UDP-N-acetylmuramoyl-tripeptide--D-alanyl-D-alanine ligase [Pseudobdellovibrionaceae bacterium]